MKNLSEAVERRLPIYYRNVRALIAEGKTKTTSKELSKRVGNTSTQVRQDFYMCGGTENYHLDNLESWLSDLLGIKKEQRMIVIGAGNLGRAIISYSDFQKDGFFIDAAFDNNLTYEGMNIKGIPILSVNLLESYFSKNNVDIAILTLPAEVALKTSEKLIKFGIKGIWNFAPIDLHSTEECIIKNISLTDSLMTLSFRMNEKDYF